VERAPIGRVHMRFVSSDTLRPAGRISDYWRARAQIWLRLRILLRVPAWMRITGSVRRPRCSSCISKRTEEKRRRIYCALLQLQRQ